MTPLHTTITSLLAALPPTDQLTFAALAEAIHSTRFTGATVIHWQNGRPRQIDLGSPVRLSIVEGLDSQTRNGSG